MTKNYEKIKFGEDSKKNSNNQDNSQSQKENIAKQKIMEKYGLTEEDAEIQLQQIKQNILNQSGQNKLNNIEYSEGGKKEILEEMNYLATDTDNDEYAQQIPQQPKEKLHEKKIEQNIESNQDPHVDDLIKELIPNYNEEISIELENVNLIFEVEQDKIDTFKETIIQRIRRKKKNKIKFQALKDINFKIYKGEKIGIIGYNGAGKSTLLNVICGIYAPTKGKVTTYGKISPLLSLGAGFDHNYSGRKNILLNGAILGYEKQFLENKIDEIIEFSELEQFIDFPIKNYSSGMLAKLGFSIATIVEPDILIIDEILGVGDVNFKKKSSDKIRSLLDSGTTVLLVSHSLPQIRELCDKAIWIDKGQVREIGEVNQVCDNYLKDSEKASAEQLKNIQFR